VILERTEHPGWLSNAYLVGDRRAGSGVVIDANERVEPLIEAARRDELAVEAILVTHHHADHVAGLDLYREAFGAPVLAHPLTARDVPGVDGTLVDDQTLEVGGLTVRALHTPGHAAGHLSLLVGDGDVFTADVLFKGTVGGTMAPGATGFADLKRSVERLLELPGSTRVHPGHREPTTVAKEREDNPFVRIWAGRDPEGTESCRVRGRDATLVLWAPDYDGGHKAWVRFADDGSDAIVGGSQVER
jgi:hydroxyacylglutathione hydrolase